MSYLILGSTGYIGSHIIKHLRKLNKKFETSSVRIENSEQVYSEIAYYQPDYVICAAGISGRPNIVSNENI